MSKPPTFLDIAVRVLLTIVGIYVVSMALAGGWMLMADSGVLDKLALALLMAIALVLGGIALLSLWRKRQ